MTEHILILADTHFGSVFAPWDSDRTMVDESGNSYKYSVNKTQMRLNQMWNEMLQQCEELSPSAIIINGDVIDGPQYAGIGKFTVTSDIFQQYDMAMHMLKPLTGSPIYMTAGTEYHSIRNVPVEQMIASALPNTKFGNDFTLDSAGVRIHCQHFIPVSTTTWQYRTTPLARDLLLLALNSAERKYGKVDIAIRSHAHYFCEASFKHQMGIITPAFQARTPYAVKRGIITPPDVGWIVLDIHDRSRICVDRTNIRDDLVPPTQHF